MTKTDLIKAIATKTGFAQKDVKVCLNATLDAIVEGTRDEGEVNLLGFGKFTAVDRPSRPFHNPLTGETGMTEPKKAPKFKFSNTFKDMVAGK